MGEAESAFFELGTQHAKGRRKKKQHESCGHDVVGEARHRYFLTPDAAADAVVALKNKNLLALDRKERGGHQRIDAAAGDHEIGAADVLAPLVRLHDPGAILAIGCSGLAGHVRLVAPVFGGHAHRVLAVAADDQVQRARFHETACAAIETAVADITAHKLKSLAAGQMGYSTVEVGDLVAKGVA